MFTELDFENFHRVRNILSSIEDIDLSVTSVFEKNYPGRILVDNSNNSSSVFLELGHRTFIFAGKETNEEFNLSIVDKIKKNIIPTKMSHFVNKFYFIIFSTNWLGTIPKIFLESVLETRKYYVFDKLKIPNWREKLPEHYSIHRIDKEFLDREQIKESSMLKKWITDIYRTHTIFLDRGFGYCMLYQDRELVSSNITNYINNKRDRIEMGIITEEKFQQKGLTKLLVSATLEHCVKEGINKIGWHTNMKNIASQKTAESVGFVHERDYIIYIGKFS
ncbi:MAG: GNAT family N-acetyltransferase [Candidatus Heimdallarchaeota archaeon]|nr:GNAT family N-acetyltransferase [Candidatus Heimdallarchaeota archaeon]